MRIGTLERYYTNNHNSTTAKLNYCFQRRRSRFKYCCPLLHICRAESYGRRFTCLKMRASATNTRTLAKTLSHKRGTERERLTYFHFNGKPKACQNCTNLCMFRQFKCKQGKQKKQVFAISWICIEDTHVWVSTTVQTCK